MQGYQHRCGNYNPFLPLLSENHLDGIEGWEPTSGMPVARTREAIGDRVCFIGDAGCLALLQGSPEQAQQEARTCTRDGGSRYVLGSSCAVLRYTSIGNTGALAETAIRDEG